MGHPAAIILYNRWYFAGKEGFAVSGNKTFSHITVSSDEEEDFVIEAGVRAATCFDEPCACDDAGGSVCDDEDEGVRGDEGGNVCDDTFDDEPHDDARLDASSSQAAVKGGKEGLYRETTMEDLESAPMSSMQKVIIAVALLFIVVAVVYYFVFMH